MPAPAPTSRTPGISDLRKAITRPAWLRNRARNALHRPAFIGAIAIGTFITAIASMIVAPKADTQAETQIVSAPRPDTLTLAGTEATARQSLALIDSTLRAARATADSIAAIPPDPILVANRATRDSLIHRVQRIEGLMARASQAPLTSSYTVLANAPELRSDPRVRPLMDSLTIVSQDRDEIGSAGGVDPVFVALTTRVSELGRGLLSIATEHRNALLAEAAALVPEPSAAEVSAIPDTALLLARRDSINVTMTQSGSDLAQRRAASAALDREEAIARQRATEIAPPLAMLGAAFVLSAVVGFAVAFIGEVRRPRVTDAAELERWLGVRVLSTVEPAMPSVDRGRREADRAAPPYFDPGAEGFQLAYLGLSDSHPSLLMATVTGDDPAIAAVVACNLAAVAVDEARHPLILDLDPSRGASAALQARGEPGLTEIVHDKLAWPDTVVATTAGRDRTVDLIPFGAGRSLSREDLAELAKNDLPRLARYYDAVMVIATAAQIHDGLLARLPAPELVYCAQPGVTPLHQLKEELDRMREAGAVVRGLVLWASERPLLSVRRESAKSLSLSG